MTSPKTPTAMPTAPTQPSTLDTPMDWERLITDKRFGLEDLHVPRRGSRTDFQRDFDRLVFSSPFRRLQNKTQVFPLPGSIFVHNRLTHSVEVASVGRSMANEVTKLLLPRHRGTPAEKSLESIGEIVAAACLAHDMGNPPFGHSGEKAIATLLLRRCRRFPARPAHCRPVGRPGTFRRKRQRPARTHPPLPWPARRWIRHDLPHAGLHRQISMVVGPCRRT